VAGRHAAGVGRGKAGANTVVGQASFGCWATAEVRPILFPFPFYFLKNPKLH
jgi:hypothetical protein